MKEHIDAWHHGEENDIYRKKITDTYSVSVSVDKRPTLNALANDPAFVELVFIDDTENQLLHQTLVVLTLNFPELTQTSSTAEREEAIKAAISELLATVLFLNRSGVDITQIGDKLQTIQSKVTSDAIPRP